MGSKAFSLSKEDLLKIGKGALIAAAGAIGAYFLSDVIPQIQGSGPVGAAVAGVLAVAVNAALKFLSNTEK